MKLLILTYSYAPDLNPRAFRWSALAQALARHGHQVHVLCASGEAAGAASEEGVLVHRVPDPFLRQASRPAGAVQAGTSARRGVVSGFARSVARALWRWLHWPDYAWGWVVPGTREARRLCAQHRYDWVISVSHPFTGHLVAWLARPAMGSARWMVDIGDPFHLMKEPPPNNRRLFGLLNRLVEGKIVSTTDAISVTTAATQRAYQAYFAPASGKVQVIPPVLSLPAAPPSSAAHAETLRLVFVGTLYRKLRSPAYLLACFARLRAEMPGRPLELHFYGALNDCADEFASLDPETRQAVFVHGLVDRAKVLQAMVDAAVLVNIGNESETQLGTKVIEYMALGKPILNIVSAGPEVSAEALVDYPAVLNLRRRGGPPDGADVAALRDFVAARPVVPREAADASVRCYSVDYVTGCYEAILQRRSTSYE